MKLSNMAVKNVKGNLYRYIMYCLSNAFAVTAFFIFANFVFHPAVDVRTADGHPVVRMGAANGMIISQVIIVIFSILFVGYSTSIFLKSRGKEFGLLSLYGMTRKQIKKYVLIENTIISILSIGTGILTGIVFSKLFFMIMEGFLGLALPLNISLKALGLTVVVFFTLFEIISIIMLFHIKDKEIIEQLKSSKIPKTIPKFSKPKAMLGIGLLLIGYITAWIVQGIAVPLAMIPVTLIVIIGTYFLFTQFSIAVANKILRNESILYKKTNLVAYSQMIFKLQDTAKVLFLASILGAITFTATGTIFSFYTESTRFTGLNTIHDMAIMQRGETLEDEVADSIEEILKKEDIKTNTIHKIKGAVLSNFTTEGTGKEQFVVISNTDYNKIVQSIGGKPIQIKENEIVYNFPHNTKQTMLSDKISEEDRHTNWDEIVLNINGEGMKFKLDKEVHGSIMALPSLGYYDALIFNDKDFDYAIKNIIEKDLFLFHGFKLENWRGSYEASMEIRRMLGDRYERSFYSKVMPYREVKRLYGLILFIGFFIAFLFLIASGSIIYFKLFNEIKQDGIEYGILNKIGTKKKEINKIITKQIGIIFFLPFVVSTFHSFFALKSLSNLLEGSLFKNGLIVMLGYSIFQIIYFIAIRGIYINKLKYN
ncbi:ABC transporter permease [Schnuerera ultunensis]|uniref:ABC transporter permease n=1 Tax=Schnuerera ultunensis TaxID=45497 RepID=UPI0003FB1F23|nr:ABC transporter permease [Schnuerera ultunensis]